MVAAMAITKTKKSYWKDRRSFLACRVKPRLLRAFKAHAKKHKTSASALVVGFMASVTGVEP